MKKTLIHSVCLHQDLNKIFWMFLEPSSDFHSLCCVHKLLYNELSLYMHTLTVSTGYISITKQYFPRLKRLCVSGDSHREIKIERNTFPNLKEFQLVNNELHNFVIEQSISLFKFEMIRTFCDSICIPFDNLCELIISEKGKDRSSLKLLQQLLQSKNLKLKKLQLFIDNVSCQTSGITIIIENLLCKLASSLEYVYIQGVRCTLPSSQLNFPNLSLFIGDTFVHIEKPHKITELSLSRTQLIVCTISNHESFYNLRKLELHGDLDSISCFLQRFGKPLCQWAPNLQSLSVSIFRKQDQMEENLKGISDLEKFLLNSFSVTNSFIFLTSLKLQIHTIISKLQLSNLVQLKFCEVGFECFQENESLLIIENLPVLEKLQVQVHTKTVVFKNLPLLKVFDHMRIKDGFGLQNYWDKIGCTKLQNLIIDVVPNNNINHLIQLIDDYSECLKEMELVMYDNNQHVTAEFLRNVFCETNWFSQLERLTISGIISCLQIQDLNVLNYLKISIEYYEDFNIEVQRCPLLKTLDCDHYASSSASELFLSDLQNLQTLYFTNNGHSDVKVKLYVQNIPQCKDVVLSKPLEFSVLGNICSEELQNAASEEIEK